MKPFHPDYGIPDEYRHIAVSHAQALGVPAAAKLSSMHPETVRQWCKRLDVTPLKLGRS
jgi:hypothetical protein